MKPWLLLTIITVSCLFACHKTAPPPSVPTFDPSQGAAGIPVLLYGLHFDTVISHLTVKFNGVPAKVFSATDSAVEVLVPAGATTGKVTLTSNSSTAASTKDFIILPGGCVRKADIPTTLPGNGRTQGIGFAIGNYGYMGLDGENGAVFHDLNRYDPSPDTWTPKAPMPLNMFAADVWTKKADFPGTKRGFEFGLAIGDIGYVGLGRDDKGNSLYDIWEYDPSVDKWTQKSDFPHNSNAYPIDIAAMTMDNKVGYLGGTAVTNAGTKLWWQYDPVKDTWTQKNNIPGYGMYTPSTMVINGKGYLTGGGGVRTGNITRLPIPGPRWPSFPSAKQAQRSSSITPDILEPVLHSGGRPPGRMSTSGSSRPDILTKIVVSPRPAARPL